MLTSLSHYIVAAALSRTIDPTAAFAAYTLGWSIAVLFEAPGITMRSAATSMGTNAADWATVHRTFWRVIVCVIFVLGIVLWTPLAGLFLQGLMGVPSDLFEGTRAVIRIAMFAVIGSSMRFIYHGILVRWRSTDGLLAGIVARLATMGVVAWVLTVTGWPGGALSGAVVLTCGMLVEGGVALLGYVRASSRPHEQHWTPMEAPPITIWQVLAFATPLALSTVLVILGRPILNASLAQAGALTVASFALASMAAGIVQAPCGAMHQVSMVFGTGGAANRRSALIFVLRVGLCFSAVTALLAYPPVSRWVFGTLIGATADLLPGAQQVVAAQIPMPLLLALSDHYAGLLLAAGRSSVVSAGRIARFVASVVLLVGVIQWGNPAYLAALASGTLVGGVIAELLVFVGFLRLGETVYGSALQGISRAN